MYSILVLSLVARITTKQALTKPTRREKQIGTKVLNVLNQDMLRRSASVYTCVRACVRACVSVCVCVCVCVCARAHPSMRACLRACV